MRGFSLPVLRRTRAYRRRSEALPAMGAYTLAVMVFLLRWVVLHLFLVLMFEPPATCAFWGTYAYEDYSLADAFVVLYAVLALGTLVFARYQSVAETVFQLCLIVCFATAMEGYFAAATNEGSAYGERLVERVEQQWEDWWVFEDAEGRSGFASQNICESRPFPF